VTVRGITPQAMVGICERQTPSLARMRSSKVGLKRLLRVMSVWEREESDVFRLRTDEALDESF
jgi:hypothetical protein